MIMEETDDHSYTVYRSKADLLGTAYIELVAGKYERRHWQEGSLFVDDEDFVAAEG
jgi:hypothetical protein